MASPQTYYTERLALFRQSTKAVKTTLTRISVLRLLIFLAAAILAYRYRQSPALLIGILLPASLLFLYLVKRTVHYKYLRKKYNALVSINETELEVLSGTWDHLEDGSAFRDSHHAFSHDVDLFGQGSFFQYLNRTQTQIGKKQLADDLAANAVTGIDEKQMAVQELAEMPDWRQEFRAGASLIKTETSEEDLLKWMAGYTPVLPHALSWLPLAWTLVSICIFTLSITSILPYQVAIVWFIGGLMMMGFFAGRISKIGVLISRSQDVFRQYQHLLKAIEEHPFKSEYLHSLQKKLQRDQESASDSLGRLSRLIDALDQRNNLLVAVGINPLTQADLFNGLRIEKWIKAHRQEVAQWFEVIGAFDAYSSKGNFAFNHPDFTYAVLSEDDPVIQARALGHPLIPGENLVRNDVTINSGEFFVITGANMAGKSTFLRTVALFIIMSNSGLPVCAEKAVYKPVKLLSSMRTADSLQEDTSYFYAELKRLKFMVEELKKEDHFIILDEILKGTNSKDKAIGSQKFVERLSASGSTGLIATHDLSLCTLSDQLEDVSNYFFDAYIENDTLSFDYKFQPGICTNMNASYLLKKMGIV